MSNLMNPEGKFMNGLCKIFDCIAISLCWVLASLPIITMGSASGALYRSMCRSIRRDDGYALKVFWDTFLQNLKHGILSWIFVLAAYAFLIADALILRTLVSQGRSITHFLGIIIVLICVCTVWAAYVAAYSARFEGGLKAILGFSFYLVAAHPLMSLLIFIVQAAGIVLGLMFPFLMILLPAGVCFVISIFMEDVFVKHMTQEDIDKMIGKPE